VAGAASRAKPREHRSAEPSVRLRRARASCPQRGFRVEGRWSPAAEATGLVDAPSADVVDPQKRRSVSVAFPALTREFSSKCSTWHGHAALRMIEDRRISAAVLAPPRAARILESIAARNRARSGVRAPRRGAARSASGAVPASRAVGRSRRRRTQADFRVPILPLGFQLHVCRLSWHNR